MRVAAIDIGTNTILMLIADVSADGSLQTVRDDQVIARIGKGVDTSRTITPEAFTRALGFLSQYKQIAESTRVERITACGTSALRDAVNAREFIDFIRQELGVEIEVLSGHEEAELTYLGAVSEFTVEDAREYAVLDIGGGSTELTTGVGRKSLTTQSLDLGCVRLTERTLKASPPSPSAIDAALKEIIASTRMLRPLPPSARVLGVAGTVTTLAAMELSLEEYDPARVSGHYLDLATIDRFKNELGSMTVTEMRQKYPQIQEGRADIILAGVLILMEGLKQVGARGIITSDRGLRYGIALREFLPELRKL